MADRRAEQQLSEQVAAPAASVADNPAPPEPRKPSRPRRAGRSIGRYFLEQPPTFWVAFTPALLIAAVLFVRSPASNYIFDEQEALLANPYVNGHELGFWSAFRRDFWGLPADRSIGSYRPIPDMIWRLLWHVSQLPWLHHWTNVVLHAVNAAVLASFTYALTKARAISWWTGAAFVTGAVVTEAISGVVGLADVLGGLGVLLALVALRLPLFVAPFAVFIATLFGLFSKESALVAVPLVAWTALIAAPLLHPDRPRRFLRALFALVSTAGALVTYTEIRRKLFPITPLPELAKPLSADHPLPERAMHAFLRWFQQPHLPHDPINNPLIDADFPHRVAGALRVYCRGLVQVVFPWRLSGDYSFRAEPIPDRLVFPESVAGAALLVLPPLIAIMLWLAALLRERRERRFASEWSQRLSTWIVLALAFVWVPVAYFPHSNIPTLLPTVRAERFWYLPLIGAAFAIGAVLAWLFAKAPRPFALTLALAFFGVQAVQARRHALDYTDDLAFWRATRNAVPDSAKAQLNYSVMVGAHLNDLDQRLALNGEALRLAPEWPMAHVYYADTLCRLGRVDDAWPYYASGFAKGPGEPNLIALGLQCLWDKHAIDAHQDDLLRLADEHPNSWLSYLANDIVANGEKHNGVDPKYRPRGYDEGPKKR